MKQIIALRLGSSTTTIYKYGEGMVLREPSLIAVSGNSKSREIRAIGKNAKRMQGRTDGFINVISPITAGIVTDSDLASSMLKGFLKQIFPQKIFKPNIKAILCVPIGLSSLEQKAFETVCYNAGIADVVQIPAILCSAIGDDIDISSNIGKMAVNIGGGCTNIAVMAQNTIISGINVNIGGATFNKAIEKHILDNFGLYISEVTAEKLRQEVGSLLETDTASTEIQGVNMTTKESESLVVTSKDIYPIMAHFYSKIADAIGSVLSTCPPDIIGDIAKEGIHIFGGNCQITGLSRFIKRKLSVPVKRTENSKTDINGAAILIENPRLLNDVLKGL